MHKCSQPNTWPLSLALPFPARILLARRQAASSTNAKCETTHDTQNHQVSVAIFPLILTQIDCLTHLSRSQRDVFSGKFNINLQELSTLLESILKFIPIPPFDSKINHSSECFKWDSIILVLSPHFERMIHEQFGICCHDLKPKKWSINRK